MRKKNSTKNPLSANEILKPRNVVRGFRDCDCSIPCESLCNATCDSDCVPECSWIDYVTGMMHSLTYEHIANVETQVLAYVA